MNKGIWALGAGLALLAACSEPEVEEEISGRALYEDYCAACHGPAGKGDGPAAAGLAARPADLTGIAARNGGTFPMVAVMSTIDGYTRRGDATSFMPEMGAEMERGRTVIFDTGDGIGTPTPEPLVALAEYLRTLQD